jgi:hypothetical protein
LRLTSLPFTLSHFDVPPGTPTFATARSASLSIKIRLGPRADERRNCIADEKRIRLEELLNNRRASPLASFQMASSAPLLPYFGQVTGLLFWSILSLCATQFDCRWAAEASFAPNFVAATRDENSGSARVPRTNSWFRDVPRQVRLRSPDLGAPRCPSKSASTHKNNAEKLFTF